MRANDMFVPYAAVITVAWLGQHRATIEAVASQCQAFE
jgi:hypothetical protein